MPNFANVPVDLASCDPKCLVCDIRYKVFSMVLDPRGIPALCQEQAEYLSNKPQNYWLILKLGTFITVDHSVTTECPLLRVCGRAMMLMHE